jgi:hypothetical protein
VRSPWSLISAMRSGARAAWNAHVIPVTTALARSDLTVGTTSIGQ